MVPRKKPIVRSKVAVRVFMGFCGLSERYEPIKKVPSMIEKKL